MRGIRIALVLLFVAPTARAGTVFVNLGTTAPPSMLGPQVATPFSSAPQAAIPDGTAVTEIPGSPFGGSLQLYQSVTKATVPSTWGTWSHGYTGPVFALAGNVPSLSFSLPVFTTAFYFYVQPQAFGNFTITATSQNGTSSGPISVNGNGGARGFGFYTTDGDQLGVITVEAPAAAGGIAIAEFGMASQQSSCTLDPIALGSDIHGMWTSECHSVVFNESLARYFTFSLTEPMTAQIELESTDQCPIVVLREGHGFFGTVIGSDYCSTFPTARINAPLAAGDYTIEATNYGFGATGSFTLRYRRGGSCVSDPQTLCIDASSGDRRFQVRVAYQTVQGGGAAGAGRAVLLADLGIVNGGVFWFFDPGNPELLIKVLPACPVNGYYWVFWSAGTNVGMTVSVTDTVAEVTRTYENQDLTAALPVQDVRAFPCN